MGSQGYKGKLPINRLHGGDINISVICPWESYPPPDIDTFVFVRSGRVFHGIPDEILAIRQYQIPDVLILKAIR